MIRDGELIFTVMMERFSAEEFKTHLNDPHLFKPIADEIHDAWKDHPFVTASEVHTNATREIARAIEAGRLPDPRSDEVFTAYVAILIGELISRRKDIGSPFVMVVVQ
jgi:hypothetical protein